MNEGALHGSMPEEPEPSPAELTEAVERIDEALAEEASLRTRTEGLTWIVWGLVTLPLILTYDATAWMAGSLAGLWAKFLWVPWVALGALLTSVLWRSAALARPGLADARQGGLTQTAAYILFILLVWFAVVWLPGRLHPDNIAIIAIGSAWTFFGALNPFGVTDTGKRVMLAVGMPTMLAGLAVAAGTVGGTIANVNVVATLASLATTGLLPIAGGAWQATRG